MNVQAISDRMEISDLAALYCRGLDRMDEACLRRIYHEDAIEDRGPGLFIGNAHEWIGWTLKVLPVFKLTQHCIMNMLIELEGDVAYGETYFHAYHRFGAADQEQAVAVTGADSVVADDLIWPEGETEMILGGRYLDRFEKRDGVWKIAYRKMVNDWCRTQPVADQWFAENPTAYRSQRVPQDATLPRG